MIQIPCLLQVSACPALFEVPHALLEHPQASQQVRSDGPFREAQVLGDLLRAQPLLEAKRDRLPVLAW